MANIIKITDLMAPELDIYARLNENQLLHYYEPDTGIFIAESPNVIIRALNAGYEPLSILLEEKEIESDAKEIIELCDNIPIFTAKLDVLTKLTGFQLTRGLLCAMYRKTLPSISDVCKNAKRIVILENVMNPTNVGAIFRSAAALNMDAVLLTHGCADPLYRRASRVSMGTVFQIPWTYIGNDTKDWYESGMDMIKEQGFKTVAMALRKDSLNVDDPRLMSEEKLAIILGTEGDGLADSTINDCDYTVCIPMSHGVDSLNVAAASAVAFWQLGKR
ncbi:MAG: RNA methyltransferase [Lachnospiraceae bacterium]|nr:RNA methyltransferase [Lachnospiraceae bacterium]